MLLSFYNSVIYRPGLLGLLKPFRASTLGCSSEMTPSSVISLGSSTSNFFSTSSPHSLAATSSTARFISGYSMRSLMALRPGVTGHV